MRTLWTVARNDLLITVKDRQEFLLGLVMPAVMMLLLGIAMSGGDETTIVIDVIDRDNSPLSAQFVTLLDEELSSGSEGFLLCPYAGEADADCDLPDDLAGDPQDWMEQADDRLKDRDSAGTIFIPAGFGAGLSAGDDVTVTFKTSDALNTPMAATEKIDAAASRLGSSVMIAHLMLRVAEDEYGTFAPAGIDRPAAFEQARSEVEAAWGQRPVLVVDHSTTEEPTHMGFNQSGPGIAIMFVLLQGLGAAAVLVLERERGTLQRLYTLPVPRWQILGGKLLARYLFALLTFVILVLVGTFMGVEWGDNIPGIALVMLVYTLTVTALGLALATVVRTAAQANSIGMLLGLTLSPLGGAWWPLEIVPDFMQTIAHLTPVAWGMDAFQEMMFYGGGVVDILSMLGVLMGMALLFFAFGVINFRYE